MIVIVDTREQNPYLFDQEHYAGAKAERGKLDTGDYSLAGFTDRIAVERKNGLDELAMCLSTDRERFERELARARSFERFYVVIEGHLHEILAGRYRSKMQPKAVIASIAAFTNRYGIPFLFCGGRGAAEMMTYQLLSKYLYEIQKRHDQAQREQGIKEPEAGAVL